MSNTLRITNGDSSSTKFPGLLWDPSSFIQDLESANHPIQYPHTVSHRIPACMLHYPKPIWPLFPQDTWCDHKMKVCGNKSPGAEDTPIQESFVSLLVIHHFTVKRMIDHYGFKTIISFSLGCLDDCTCCLVLCSWGWLHVSTMHINIMNINIYKHINII